MGLTHHWHRPTELPTEHFRAAVQDFRKLIVGGSTSLAGFDGSGEPILDEERIVFNGKGPTACEPFEISAVEFDRRGRPDFFGHCKTEHQPYDLYVKAALIVLSHHLNDSFRVSSDADNSDWDDARSLVQSHLGYGSAFQLTSE